MVSKNYDADLVGCDLETGGLNGYFDLDSGERVHGAMLIGNNIGIDFSFIDAQMPELAKFFHYRKIDISAVNVLSRTAWKGLNIPQPAKVLNHTALSDICESIDELNGYTKHFMSENE